MENWDSDYGRVSPKFFVQDTQPSGELDGDTWINTNTFDLAVFDGSIWSVKCNIKGAKGDNGGVAEEVIDELRDDLRGDITELWVYVEAMIVGTYNNGTFTPFNFPAQVLRKLNYTNYVEVDMMNGNVERLQRTKSINETTFVFENFDYKLEYTAGDTPSYNFIAK